MDYYSSSFKKAADTYAKRPGITVDNGEIENKPHNCTTPEPDIDLCFNCDDSISRMLDRYNQIYTSITETSGLAEQESQQVDSIEQPRPMPPIRNRQRRARRRIRPQMPPVYSCRCAIGTCIRVLREMINGRY
ncbi:unnamed protein product [Moneuplotes crassus]|uniref:Uncharacterized protein n=1 Tax=Euplotes crassus TaxID=5936 RepID=A0AAD2D1K3_EUPCR|nr:unnamed protein product [Moneuplotes crassus]